MKNKHKGFTIVELVIVIAVVAVLAAVVIPTFAAIVKEANVSADTQAARNMNVILASESASSPAGNDPAAVLALLKENGFTELSPQTKFYTFYWLEGENVILLADEGDRPVYPEEYLEDQRNSSWHALDRINPVPLPTAPESSEEVWVPQTFTVSVSQSGSSVNIPFENIPTTATEGSEFNVDICLPAAYQTDPMRYTMQKITVIMHDGETEHKIEIRSRRSELSPVDNMLSFEVDETAALRIPCVTGNIEINIDVVEYCIVTFRTVLPDGTEVVRRLPLAKRHNTNVLCDSFSEAFLEKHKIVSAKAFRDGVELGELYNKRGHWITLTKELKTSDLEVIVYVEEKTNE